MMSKQRKDTETEEDTPLLESDYRENVSCQFIQARHVLALWAFLGFFNVYCLRVNLSVALVAMVKSVNVSESNDTDSTECKAPGGGDNSTVQKEGEFPWGEQTQGLILGSFFYGYIVTQVPGGFLAEKFGAKKLFGFGVLCTSVLTLLTPLAARSGLPYFIAVRVLEGIGEGVTFPSMHSMWGQWAPVFERSKLAGFSYSGAQLGVVLAMPVSGMLCASDFLGGWPSVFYVFGAIGCLWFVMWMCLIHETPADHPRITRAEREYIERSIGKKEHVKTPWLKIFTSPALWGIVGGHFANNWGQYTFLTCLPTFMKRILKFDIQADGFLSAIPYIALSLVQILIGVFADFLRSNNFLSTKNTRKLMNTSGLLLPAAFIIGVSYVGCDHIWAVTLLVLALGSSGITMGGYMVSHLDIAPRFSGVLLGITNGIATIPGFLGPQVVGIITDHNQTIAGWREVFFITVGIYVLGAVIFVLLAQGEEQSWAKIPDTEEEVIGEKKVLSVQAENSQEKEASYTQH